MVILIVTYVRILQGFFVAEILEDLHNGKFKPYADYNPTCRILILKFQRIDPATGKKIGTPKTLLGCSDIGTSLTGVYGLDAIDLP